MTQPEKRLTTVLNDGGGRQTITMLILIAKGVFPRPDYVVCAHIREEDLARGGPGVYLHHSAVPLSEADIDRGPEQVREDQCSLGACFP